MYESKLLQTDFTINCKGKLIDLSTPNIMGIVNCTPDSFYNIDTTIFSTIDTMVQEGVDMIDIGGMSSKPNANEITEEEEWKRIEKAIIYSVKKYPTIPISIDTYRSHIAQKSIDNGASIINDISAGNLDPEMIKCIAKMQVPYIAMHMQGTPKNMQINPTYENVLTEVIDFFIQKIDLYKNEGINNVILDVGFGFGKTIEHNFELLKNLHCFKILEKPLLAGISRKSMIYKTLETEPTHALNGTTALHMIALQQGAKILRAHDVKEAKECVTLYNKLYTIGG
jgi:dihydropteroate synthase